MIEPLAPGEKVDLDSGTTVRRGERDDADVYMVSNHRPGNSARTKRVLLEGEETRLIAELVGYTVDDGDDR